MLSLRPACRLLPRLACLVMGLVLGAAAPGTVASAETTKVAKPMEKLPAGFHAATAKVKGTTLYYRIGGKGSAVLLLTGNAERKSVVEGKGVAVRVDRGGGRTDKKKRRK